METVFLDIGSGDGSRAQKWLELDKKAYAFCFDPRRDTHEIAIKRAAEIRKNPPKTDRLLPFPIAVSDKPQGTLHILNDPSSNSLIPIEDSNVKLWKYPAGRRYFKVMSTTDVPVIRMDKFLADRRIKQILFARIETQGTAMDVLKSFGKRISTVMEFAIKVHTVDFDIYTGQTKKDELLAFMASNGFLVFGRTPWSRKQEEVIWFVNRLAVNNPRLTHFDLE